MLLMKYEIEYVYLDLKETLKKKLIRWRYSPIFSDN